MTQSCSYIIKLNEQYCSIMSKPADESFFEKVVRKTKNEPLVPLGALVTTGFLLAGFRSFTQGRKHQAQMLMRGRVLAQGFTVIAMGVGAFLGMKPHERPQSMEEVLHNLATKREQK